MKPESDRQTAVRLSEQLGFTVSRGMLRYWRKRSFDLNDPEKLRHQLRNLQKSRPGFKATTAPSDRVPHIAAELRIFSPDEISEQIHALESAIISAPDYEVARTISTQLAGLRAAARLRAEMELFVTRASVQKDMVLVDAVFRAIVLRLPAELPSQIIGVNYPEAVKRCDEYAYSILLEVSNESTYEAQ